MGLTITSEPSEEPLTAAELKTHLRYPKSDEDDLITGLIAAARKRYEIETRRVLIDTGYTWTLDSFPGERHNTSWSQGPQSFRGSDNGDGFWGAQGMVRLPRGPLINLTRIIYTDTNGVDQTLSTSVYEVGADGDMPARLAVRHAETWPDTRDEIDSVQIKFTAGHGTAASEVPDIDKAAIRLIVGNWWSNREEVLAGSGYTVTEMPRGAGRIISMRTLPYSGGGVP